MVEGWRSPFIAFGQGIALAGGFLMDPNLFVQSVLFGLCCLLGLWAVR